MKKTTIAVTRKLPSQFLDKLEAHGAVDWPADISESSVMACLSKAEYALITHADHIDQGVLDRSPHLQAISTISAGFNHIDLDACTRRSVLISNSPTAVSNSTADLSFALLLAAARRVREGDDYIRRGHWTVDSPPLLGRDVHHSTLGIVGLGRIGCAIAARARGFEMNVIYYSIERLSNDEEKFRGVQYVQFDELLERSDFIIVQVPYSSATHHLIGAAELAKMKRTAVLVNSARGGIIDDQALVEALLTGRIAAAALDVFENEPYVNSKLLTLQNVVLSPHSGASTQATHEGMISEAVENILQAIAGHIPVNCLNPRARVS